jgi:hypothetical protein
MNDKHIHVSDYLGMYVLRIFLETACSLVVKTLGYKPEGREFETQ